MSISNQHSKGKLSALNIYEYSNYKTFLIDFQRELDLDWGNNNDSFLTPKILQKENQDIISKVIRGKVRLTENNLVQLFSTLNLYHDEEIFFRTLVHYNHANKFEEKDFYFKGLSNYFQQTAENKKKSKSKFDFKKLRSKIRFIRRRSKKIVIKLDKEKFSFDEDELIAVKAGKNHVYDLYFENKIIYFRRTIKEWLEILDRNQFQSIHRNTIINKNKIEAVKKRGAAIKMVSVEQPFDVSRAKVSEVRKLA